jgi:nitroimidazol reductase NimA-like FMN-containing flavoprotein (pyridoxamine 5'-phosphate oxidase superfamily)
MDKYVPTERSKVRRLNKRAAYDHATVHAILDAGVICHVGYVIDGQPYVTPTAYWREGNRLYWHGSSASRMLRSQKAGLPVCLTVTHLDGLVLARSGFHHSVNYRAVMAFGKAAIVTGEAERLRALNTFVERLYPGRNAEVRGINPQELKATLLIGMTIEEASAKVRTGPPIDDEEDYALPCWAGVIGLRQVVTGVVADPRLTPGIEVPGGLAAFGEGAALDAVLSRYAADEREVALS